MIWRSLTFFRFTAFGFTVFSFAAAPLHAASLSGAVALRDSHVEAVTKQKDYSGVVISAIPVSEPAAAPGNRHSTMLQKNKTFTPHVLPVETGTTVDFPNADPIFHNAFSSYSGQIFDVGLYPPGTNRSVRFTRPGAVRVFCNIHPTMSAIILVVNSPYFTTTAKDGSWEMNVPPGDYDIRVFHERATEQTLAGLSLRIVVGDQPVRLPTIAVSEAGYLLAPHKNKYGRDYDSSGDDSSVYPQVHK
jgi:plastocyanin